MEDKLHSNDRIGVVVNKIPGSANVLEVLGVDYYCHGNISLAEACAEAGYDVDGILEGIYNAIPEKTPRCERDLSKAGMDRLLDHMMEEHYGFIIDAMPQLTRLIRQVIRRHGKSHPELIELEHLFTLLREEIGLHVLKEENLLYKLIGQFSSGDTGVSPDDESPEKQIQFLEQEHVNIINILAKIRHLTKGYVVPEDACIAYRAMLKKIKELELNVHRYIHEENNIIFPRVLQIVEGSVPTQWH
jgi:regulator of cell morphogenesis and NO signaling